MIEYDAISSRYTYPYIYIQFPICTPQRWWMWLVPDLVWTFSALEAAPGWNWWGMWGLPWPFLLPDWWDWGRFLDVSMARDLLIDVGTLFFAHDSHDMFLFSETE